MSNTIKLSKPVMRGENEITSITLHEPNAGSLRGISISDLLNLNTDAITKLIPRISDPKLTEQEMQRFGLRDLANMGGAIANFFLTDEERAAATADTQSQTT